MSPFFRVALLAGAFTLAAGAHAQLKPSTTLTPAAPAAAAPAAAAPAANPADAEKEAAGKMAAFGWLTVLDRKDWGTAWDQSSTLFRQTVPLGTWMDSIPKVREPFGVLLQREPAETIYKTTLPGRPNGHYVSTIFVSKFEKAMINEIVLTMIDTDGRWRVVGYTYNVRP